MSSARPPRLPWASRAGVRDRDDPSAPPPAVTDLLARRGWGVVEQGEGPGPGTLGPRRWVASDGSGRYHDVSLVRVPADPAARDLLVERLDALRLLDDEHLVPVEEIVEGGEGVLVLISRRPPGGGLRLLLACRGPLEAGEAVTLLVPLAQALAALHASGLSYGGVAETDVLVDAEGRAVLRAPLELCALPAPDDVRSLAELVVGVLPPPAGAPLPGEAAPETPDPSLAALQAELATARRADPRTRPEVGTFAALCYEASPPTPIAMPDGARLAAAAIAARRAPAPSRREPSAGRDVSSDDTVVRSPRRPGRGVPPAGTHPGPGGQRALRRREHARRRRSAPGARPHPALLAGLVLVVCSALVTGGMLVRSHLAGADPSAARRAVEHDGAHEAAGAVPPDPTSQAQDPAAAAVELTERRIELLTGEREPGEVLAPGSPAEAVDADLLDRIAASGVTIEGARASDVEAHLVVPGGDGPPTGTGTGAVPLPGTETQVEVRYSVSEHTQRAADGSATTVAATRASTARLTLRWTDDGWRVSDVA
ncbi:MULTISPECIES: hypothetical protein [Oerskovia]|uniref:Protein kinase domain-containing protein n=1 Tax=Oerskovia gallyi TaxID=2762226 RepID=A0ABR8UZ84_9CELL|nr:hypothetical protein [Oerskovia gallyi]MBD7997381.1 hypothetical protein [Oerskovia gallyi]